MAHGGCLGCESKSKTTLPTHTRPSSITPHVDCVSRTNAAIRLSGVCREREKEERRGTHSSESKDGTKLHSRTKTKWLLNLTIKKSITRGPRAAGGHESEREAAAPSKRRASRAFIKRKQKSEVRLREREMPRPPLLLLLPSIDANQKERPKQGQMWAEEEGPGGEPGEERGQAI